MKNVYRLTKRDFLKAGLAGFIGAAACPFFPYVSYAASAGIGNKRVLIVYFSMPETDKISGLTEEEENSVAVIEGKAYGNTQYMAYVIRGALGEGTDIFRIEPQTPYPTDHKILVSQAKDEQRRKFRPPLKSKIENLERYDVVFLGYPTWWYELPMILYTFLEQHDLSGKTIIPFNTHGGSGFSDTLERISELQPEAVIRRDGLSVSRDRIADAGPDIVKWVNGLK